MRNTLLVGAVLAVAAAVVVLLSSALDLGLESVALLGVAVGAVVALVPDRSPLMRLSGFAAGVVIAWVGYLIRAGFLPDSAGGRAVTAVIVIALVVGVAAATMNRVPLWAALLGVVAMVGAYEFTFAAAIPEAATTSVTAVTALLFAAAVGFLVAALLAPGAEEPAQRSHRRPATRADETTEIDEMMEKSQ